MYAGCRIAISLFCIAAGTGCSSDPKNDNNHTNNATTPNNSTGSNNEPAAGGVWDFEDGTLQGFGVDITDFEEPTRGGLEFEVVAMPEGLDGTGVRVFADNRSDDLWHFLWRELGPGEGVEADTTYTALLELDVASNTASGCVGVGGAPDGVTLKGGVVNRLPEPALDGEYIGFSIDKGAQTQIGPEAVDLGTIGTENTDCIAEGPWHLLERSGTMTVTSTADGKLWVYVGGDSGFEASSTLYYDAVRVVLTPQ